MSMPLFIEWKLITNGEEIRLEQKDNFFEVTYSGYKLFPINKTIEIKRHMNSNEVGLGKIVELAWRNNETVCKYQLLSLNTVN